MTSQRNKRIQSVFTRATKIKDAAKRELYLEEACRSKQWLRAEVESLLRHHDKTDPFYDAYTAVSGKTISHYRIGRSLGKGGMGEVYRARDLHLGRVVAVKVLPSRLMGDARSRARLIAEAKRLSALNHPNIVTVYELEHANHIDLIVMEYLPGETLNSLIPPRGLPTPKALRYALQIVDALHTAHAAGILHGDLSPGNVMVNNAGRAKLLDFGLAKALATRSPKSTEVSEAIGGTLRYMAPELQLGHQALRPTRRSELFAVGLILHQMLSGRHPFHFGNRDEIPQAIRTKKPRPLPARVPTCLKTIVQRCLEKNPANRFRSMSELLDTLRRCESKAGKPQTGLNQTGEIAPPNRPKRRSSDLRKVRAIIARIEYKNVARSRQALAELVGLINSGITGPAREAATTALRERILTLDTNPDGVPNFVRMLRKEVFEILRLSKQVPVNRCFRSQDFEGLDLYGMNFASEQLAGLSFRGCFLAEASFKKSDLTGASFAGAYMRNADFFGAALANADFTDADWFNAPGLTEDQLGRVRRDTLIPCPPDVPAMHRYLESHYGIPFDAWSGRVQEQLKSTWNEYLHPGGLRDIVAVWRQRPQ